MKLIYLAGRLFNAGERLHNLYLEKYLKQLGYSVVLPQREAAKFFDGKTFNMDALVQDCMMHSANRKSICIANIDGPDADSGTAFELAVAIVSTGRAVVYRTDFRTDMDKELGVNAMLRAPGTHFVYDPCFFTKLEEVDSYYWGLAQRIHQAIVRLIQNPGYRETLKPQGAA